MNALAGKRVIVTGASMGIGRAVAERCVTEGASVVVNARGEETLAETVAALEAIGGDVVGVPGSVASHNVAGHLVAAAVDHFDGVDVLINCAGIAEPAGSTVLTIEPADWQHQLDVHLTGTFNTCQNAAWTMVKQGHGTIVNTSSHGFLGIYGGSGYPAGKGGTNSLTYVLAGELAEHGIRANAVCPGGRTRLSTGADYEATIERLHAKGILDDLFRDASLSPAPPEYVAALYVYLASDASAPTTGEIFWGAGPYAGRFPKPEATYDYFGAADAPPPSIDDLAAAFGAPTDPQ